MATKKLIICAYCHEKILPPHYQITLYDPYTKPELIRNETIDMAAAKLRNNGHFGLASMLKHNTDIDYVEGGEYTWTDEKTQDAEFTRFDIKGQSRLDDIKSKRIVPQEYDAKKQKKIDD